MCIKIPNEECCNDKHDRDENCSIVGAYTILSETATSGNGVAQFNADGTMSLSLIEDSNPNFPLTGSVGLWKCTGKNCFKFLVTNVLASVTCTPPNTDFPCGVLNPNSRLTFTANFCFDSACQIANGTLIQNVFALNDLALKTPIASPSSFTITLQRVNILVRTIYYFIHTARRHSFSWLYLFFNLVEMSHLGGVELSLFL